MSVIIPPCEHGKLPWTCPDGQCRKKYRDPRPLVIGPVPVNPELMAALMSYMLAAKALADAADEVERVVDKLKG